MNADGVNCLPESRSPSYRDRDYFKDMDINAEQYEARQWIQSIVNTQNLW